ncbi:MAG: histidinol-phosphatase [Acidiferrobacterales bacterium]
MSLAIFDLDNTLLAGDSDYEWGRFLVQQGIVDSEEFERKNQQFYDDYKAGRLDIFGFLKFALKPLAENDRAQLDEWHKQYMRIHVLPLISDGARALVESHRQRGDTLLIMTATNSFVTAPIAKEFGIDNLLATEPEVVNGQFTGNVDGTPCFKQGKVERLDAWMQQHGANLDGSTFYSDSHNDLPLLKRVAQPVAVRPDDALRQEAEQHGWRIIENL